MPIETIEDGKKAYELLKKLYYESANIPEIHAVHVSEAEALRRQADRIEAKEAFRMELLKFITDHK